MAEHQKQHEESQLAGPEQNRTSCSSSRDMVMKNRNMPRAAMIHLQLGIPVPTTEQTRPFEKKRRRSGPTVNDNCSFFLD
jgi:hypothetical protein